jgi:formylglycine-generating enzyme required for sulfatase activity
LLRVIRVLALAGLGAQLASCGSASRPLRPGAPASARLPSCPERMAVIAGGNLRTKDVFPGQPEHDVPIQSFCLDLDVVTVDAYAACAREGLCTADHPGEMRFDGKTFMPGSHCTYDVPGKGDHPMTCVDWDQATTYCQTQHKRLPTAEEWEWAERGARKGHIGWGVGEWTSTKLDAGNASVPCSEDRPCPLAGVGDWYDVDPQGFRPAIHDWDPLGSRIFRLGFRCAR